MIVSARIYMEWVDQRNVWTTAIDVSRRMLEPEQQEEGLDRAFEIGQRVQCQIEILPDQIFPECERNRTRVQA